MTKTKVKLKSEPLPRMSPAVLATEIYDLARMHTESFEGRLGEDLAYLMGAILTGGCCEWEEGDSPLVALLRTVVSKHHQVWRHISKTDVNEMGLNDHYDAGIDCVRVKLSNGNEIHSGWCDNDDPDAQLAGDYLAVSQNGRMGNQVFYLETADLTAMTAPAARRKLQEFICACLGVPVPEAGHAS